MHSASNQPGFAAALSLEEDSSAAVADVARQLAGSPSPDLAVAFVSHHHGGDWDELASKLHQALGAKTLIGCTGESIVSGQREVEGEPALSVWTAHLPGSDIRPLHLEFVRTASGASIVGWPDDLIEDWPQNASLVLLGEPYTFATELLLKELNDDRPGTPVLGGMASGGQGPGTNRVFLNGKAFEEGAVGVLLSGNVRVRTVVSQGCRPIGTPLVVTKAEKNVILELGGRPPLARLQEMLPTLDERDQQLIREGLHLGRVTNEYRDKFSRGDFLVRNVVGADPKSGAIAIGDYVRTGQTVQFHVRDSVSADEDLRELLAATELPASTARGGLLFTCNGRGVRLFGEPDHDALVVQEVFPGLPLAGFFAQGEIGPIGGRNFLHGFTASLALFECPGEG